MAGFDVSAARALVPGAAGATGAPGQRVGEGGLAIPSGGAADRSGAASGLGRPGEVGKGPAGVGGARETGFAGVLDKALGELEASHAVARDKTLALVTGQDVAVHDVMAAVTEAGIATQLTTAVAVKAITAYQEIWRMEI